MQLVPAVKCIQLFLPVGPRRHDCSPSKDKPALSRQCIEKQHCLSPSSIDLCPVYIGSRAPAEAQAIDSCETGVMPDGECIIVDVRLLEALQEELVERNCLSI